MITSQHTSNFIVPDLAIHATVGLTPIAAFVVSATPYLTALSALFAILWFGVMFYDRFLGKRKDKNIDG